MQCCTLGTGRERLLSTTERWLAAAAASDTAGTGLGTSSDCLAWDQYWSGHGAGGPSNVICKLVFLSSVPHGRWSAQASLYTQVVSGAHAHHSAVSTLSNIRTSVKWPGK